MLVKVLSLTTIPELINRSINIINSLLRSANVNQLKFGFFYDIFFTREYMQCTAGFTFCFVVGALGAPLIKLASISADS
jgi:hypothetical protein